MKVLNWFQSRPLKFSDSIEVAGCMCQWNQKILFLKRAPGTFQENTWGLPAGKLERSESAEKAVVRELLEETTINIQNMPIKNIGSLYIQRSDANVAFHIFHAEFLDPPIINLLEKENVEAKWVTLDEALKLPLIVGGLEVIQVLQNYIKCLNPSCYLS